MDAYGFCLAWRWTQATHNVLPPEVMAQIKPLDRVTLPIGLVGGLDPLDRSRFCHVVTTGAEGDKETGETWLSTLPVMPDDRITVRWNSDEVAVETSWAIFVKFWNDFCYPASDDVQIFPSSGDWLLLYHHYEEFEWGQRKRS